MIETEGFERGFSAGRDVAFARSQQKVPFKLGCLKDTFRHALQATNPCAVAYSYARIRRLVRLGVGFYCGSVADESAIGFSDSVQVKGASAFQARLRICMSAISLWWLYAGDPCGLPGAFDRFANLRTAATFLFSDWVWRLHPKGASP
jgi:hypothetical protein